MLADDEKAFEADMADLVRGAYEAARGDSFDAVGLLAGAAMVIATMLELERGTRRADAAGRAADVLIGGLHETQLDVDGFADQAERIYAAARRPVVVATGLPGPGEPRS